MPQQIAVFFDLDGTWYRWQLFYEWIVMAVREGLLPPIVLSRPQDSYKAYLDREGTFDEFVRETVRAYQDDGRLRGLRVEDARFVARKVVAAYGKRVHVFTRDLAAAAAEEGMLRVAISGSIHEIVEAFAAANDVPIFFGTEHPKEEGVFTGGNPHEWCREKGNVVRRVAAEHDIDLGRSVAIGDSPSDAQMLELVGFPICFNPTSDLLAIAKENEWPVVFEKKDVRMVFTTRNGRLEEGGLDDALPGWIVSKLQWRRAVP